MLFPAEDEYRAWFERAGFTDIAVSVVAPDWYRGRSPYAVSIRGTKPQPGASPLAARERPEDRSAALTPVERLRFAGRFVLGSAAGLAFVPIGVLLSLRARLARRG
jgi:MPBQ/MSBQ methyltransferase